VQAYQESVKVFFRRYVAEKASCFEVLDFQLQLYPAENALAATGIESPDSNCAALQSLGWRLEPEGSGLVWTRFLVGPLEGVSVG